MSVKPTSLSMSPRLPLQTVAEGKFSRNLQISVTPVEEVFKKYAPPSPTSETENDYVPEPWVRGTLPPVLAPRKGVLPPIAPEALPQLFDSIALDAAPLPLEGRSMSERESRLPTEEAISPLVYHIMLERTPQSAAVEDKTSFSQTDV